MARGLKENLILLFELLGLDDESTSRSASEVLEGDGLGGWTVRLTLVESTLHITQLGLTVREVSKDTGLELVPDREGLCIVVEEIPLGETVFSGDFTELCKILMILLATPGFVLPSDDESLGAFAQFVSLGLPSEGGVLGTLVRSALSFRRKEGARVLTEHAAELLGRAAAAERDAGTIRDLVHDFEMRVDRLTEQDQET